MPELGQNFFTNEWVMIADGAGETAGVTGNASRRATDAGGLWRHARLPGGVLLSLPGRQDLCWPGEYVGARHFLVCERDFAPHPDARI